MRFLFISNGYGEDNVSAHIARVFPQYFPGCTVSGFPTVGGGKFYTDSGIDLAGRGPDLPSEGFVRSYKDLFNDILNGFFHKTFSLGVSLRKVSSHFDYLVLTGDPYLLLLNGIFTKKPKANRIFVGVQQSEWYGSKKAFKQHYSTVERQWLKRFAGLVFVRDHKTEHYLVAKGLENVKCMGNPMMDCFSISKCPRFPVKRTLVGILPGSKKEAYDNLPAVFRIVQKLAEQDPQMLFAVALSPNLDREKVVHDFHLRQVPKTEKILIPNAHQYELPRSTAEIVISQNSFGDIINESRAVIGLSGTGNEQAAGLGKPVFAFWGKGPQMTEKFLVAQKRLLGPSLQIGPPDAERIAWSILDTLKNGFLLKKIEENGKMRMAGRGSIRLMAEEIRRYVVQKTRRIAELLL
jgi:uncharacterized protein (TIGR03492 family)